MGIVRMTQVAKSAKLGGPMELVAQDLFAKFPINMIMNDVSGIGSCAEKGVLVLDPLQKKLANGIFQLFELDTI